MPKRASDRARRTWRVGARVRRERRLTRSGGDMTYRVELTDRAVRDLEILYLEKNTHGSRAAARWFNRLEKAVCGLEQRPHRCPAAPESRTMKGAMRPLFYGKK